MKEDFCTYSQAVRLKKLGFDWECIAEYGVEPDGKPILIGSTAFVFRNPEEKGRDVTAPSLSQATKWLRDVRGLIVCCEPRFYRGRRPLMGYDYHLYNKEDGSYSHIASKEVYDTYEAALSAGLDAALKLLEENSSSN